MRTKNALKNLIVATVSYCFLTVVALLVRRLLLHSFDVELIAYDGLLSNIFSLMAVAEMGTSGLFDYRMFQAFAKNDHERIEKLLSMFRMAYRLIAFVILGICTVVFFLLPVFFAGKVKFWGYFRIMYVLYAVSTLATYFLGYWRTLLVAGQREYKVVAIQTMLNVGTQLAKLLILWTTRRFLLYQFITCLTSLSTQFFSKRCARKEYPAVGFVPVTWQDFKTEGMFREARELVLIKLSSTVMYSTDNLLILLLVSTTATAMYNNYCLIASAAITLVFKLIQPMHATIANLVNQESKESSFAFFKTLDLWCFFLASVLLVCFGIVLQPAIAVFFDEQFLLPYSFVVAFALQYYVNTKKQAVAEVRGSFGDFHIERFYNIIGMFLNIGLSLTLGHCWGITGIVFGTIAALLFFWIGFAVIVIRNYYQKSWLSYWGREFLFLLLAVLEFGIAYVASYRIPYTFIGIVLRCIIGVTVPTTLNILLFCRTQAFLGAVYRLRSVLTIQSKRGHNTKEK